MPDEKEIDDEIRRHQQITALIVNLCDPEVYHYELKEIGLKKREIKRVKNELIFLLFFAVDMLLDSLCQEYGKKLKENHDANYSLTIVKLTNVRALFVTGFTYLAQKRGISNPDEEIGRRVENYRNAIIEYDNAASPFGMVELGNSFIRSCGIDYDLILGMYITKLFSNTRIKAMDILKNNLHLPE